MKRGFRARIASPSESVWRQVEGARVVRSGTGWGRVAAVAACVAVGAALSGCAAGEPATRPWTQPSTEPYATAPPSGDPVRDLSAKQALNTAVSNTSKASVHVHGTVTDQLGVAHRLDLRYGPGGSGCSGTVSAADSTAQVLRVGKDVWVKAPYGFWAAVGGSTFAAEYRNKYVRAPAGNPAFQGLVDATWPGRLIGRLTKGAGGPAKGSGGKRTIDGRPAVPLRTGGGAGYGGTIWVSADGSPRLLRIAAADGSPVTGTVDFSDYDQANEPVPPRPDQVAQ
jgi:hypothetical protein